MTSQKAAKGPQTEVDEQRKPGSPQSAEPGRDESELLSAPLPSAALGGGSVESSTTLLKDPRLQGAQRQVLSRQFGRLYGNRGFQRMIGSTAGPASGVARRAVPEPAAGAQVGLAGEGEGDGPRVRLGASSVTGSATRAPAVVQRGNGGEEEAQEGQEGGADDFVPVEVTSSDWRGLRRDGMVLASRLFPGVNQIVVLTGRLRVFSRSGELVGSFALRGNFHPGNGVYAIGSDANLQLGVRGGRTATRSIAFDPESMSEDLRTRTAGRQVINWNDWVDITPEREREVFQGPWLLIASSASAARAPARGGEEAAEQQPAEERPGEQPAAEQRPAGFAPEFAAERGRSRPYEYPPLPATVQGLPVQPVGGTGIYAMQLDYRAAARDLLGQASWAFQSTGYRWELWDISNAPGVREAAARVRRGGLATGGGGGRTVGRMEGAGRGLGRASEELQRRPGEIEADRREAMEEGRYLDAMANEINERLLGLEVISRYGSELLGAVADLFADDRERQIPWSREGVYVVRCIAAINPNAPPDRPARAPSVGTRVVIVRPLERISREAIDAPAAQLAELELQLALLRALPEDDPRRAQISELEGRRQTLQIEATGSPVEVIQQRLRLKQRELEQARNSSVMLRHGLSDSRVSQLEREVQALQDQLRLAQTRAGQISRPEAPARRAQGVLISQVSGQTYPLLLQIGEPVLDGETWRCGLSDVTSRDADRYVGEAPNRPGNEQDCKLRAVWEAVERFAGDAGYGQGSLTIRLPAEGWFATLSAADRTRTVPSRPRDWAAARARLEELATMIAMLGLVVSGPAIGLAGAGLAAALAGERIARRISNDTFRWDTQTVGDLIDVFSGVASGVRAFGSLRYFARAEGGFGLRVVRGVGRAAGVAEEALDVAGVIQCNAETLDRLIEIQRQVNAGTLTQTEARRQRAQIIAQAVQTNAITFASRLRGGEEGGRAEEGEAGRPEATRPEGARPEEGRAGPEQQVPRTPGGGEEGAGRAPDLETAETERQRPVDLERATTVRDTVEDLVLPEATVMMPPPRRDTSPQEQLRYVRDAQTMFENTWRGGPADSPAERQAARSREAALYRNTESGEFIIIQGARTTVYVEGAPGSTGPRQEAPQGAGYSQRWKEILDGADVGRWELVAHSHPGEGQPGGVGAWARFPSGGEGDMGIMVTTSQQAGGLPRNSRIYYETADGPNYTDYGYNPAAANPFWISYPDPTTGERTRIDFPDMEAYHDWYRQTFGVDLGPIPEAMRRTTEGETTTPEGTTTERVPTGETTAPEGTTTERVPTGETTTPEGTTTERDRPEGPSAGPRAPEGAEGQWAEIDASRYRAVGEPERGTSESTILEDTRTGERFLFKPTAGEAQVSRAMARGVRPGSYAGRAAAAGEVAQQLGLETPRLALVRYQGQTGSLQRWADRGITLADLQADNPSLYERVVRSPEYQRLRADIDAFDYLINNLDRNLGNLLVELGPDGQVLRLTPIDHDLTFPATAERPILRGWTRPLPDRYSRAMYDRLRQMDSNREGLRNALRRFLSPAEVEATFARLDAVLADIEAKRAARGDEGTFYTEPAPQVPRAPPRGAAPGEEGETGAAASMEEARGVFQEAMGLYERGQFRRAAVRFERARQMPGISAEDRQACLYNLGRANLRMNRFATAIIYFQEYLATPGADLAEGRARLREAREGAGVRAGPIPEAEAEASVTEARATFEEAMRLYQEGDYRRAIIRFERARQTPGMPDEVRQACLYHIGEGNLRLHRFATAIVYFEEYLTMPGADVEQVRAGLREARQGAGVVTEE